MWVRLCSIFEYLEYCSITTGNKITVPICIDCHEQLVNLNSEFNVKIFKFLINYSIDKR